MSWTLVPAAALVAAPWRNGRGTSYEIAGETGASVPLWQVSIAELERDGPFSHYPHCDRVFTPISGGPPPELAFRGGSFEPCPLLVPKPFPGDVPTLSRIRAPGRAFNAIVDRRRHRVEVRVAREGALAAPAAARHGVVHCLQGRVDLGTAVLGPGDSAVGLGRAALDGPGVLIAVAVY